MKAGQDSWRTRDSPRRQRSSNSRNGRKKITTHRSRPNCACSPKQALPNRIAFGERRRSPFLGACGPDYRPDVIRGSLEPVQSGVDLGGIEVDETERSLRETEFSASSQVHQDREFGSEMIGNTNNL